MLNFYADERVYSTLHDLTGIPGARVAFGDKKPKCPRFLYRLREGGEVVADGLNYAAMPKYTARLYLSDYDSDTVAAFARAVSSIGPYTYDEEWSDEDGGKYVAVFDFTVCKD